MNVLQNSGDWLCKAGGVCGAGAGAQVALTTNLSRWMLVPSSQVNLDGATCNMAGTGYTAFANQAVYLLLPPPPPLPFPLYLTSSLPTSSLPSPPPLPLGHCYTAAARQAVDHLPPLSMLHMFYKTSHTSSYVHLFSGYSVAANQVIPY